MKKLILLLLICSTIISCTFVDQADTYVNCPCTVFEITQYEGNVSYVRSRSIQNDREYISFYTTTQHQLGDTIQ